MKNETDELIKIYAREALHSVIMGKLPVQAAINALRRLRKLLSIKTYPDQRLLRPRGDQKKIAY